jgi:hypothetical protein
MIFNQIYRILSFLVSAAFLVIVGFAIYDMTKRLEYRSINLFEILLAGAFFIAALSTTWFSIFTIRYDKQKNKSSELIDFEDITETVQKRKNAAIFYTLGIVNLILAIAIIIFFCYGFALNFLSGRQFNHTRILPLIILSFFILFGVFQMIYSIRMIHFYRSLKQ